jgi:hypothetical protein
MQPDAAKQKLSEAERLTDLIRPLQKIFNGNISRAGFSAQLVETVQKVPRTQPFFFSFHKPEDIPPEFKQMIENWCQRLIAERLKLWHELQTAGVPLP